MGEQLRAMSRSRDQLAGLGVEHLQGAWEQGLHEPACL